MDQHLMGKIALAFALVLGAAACTTDGTDTRVETAGLPSTRQDLEAHEWVLDGRGSSPAIRRAGRVTITFDGDAAFGTGPCNTYRATLEVDDIGDGVTIEDLRTTLRACGDAAMRAEDEYFAALEAVTSADADHDDDHLTLTGDGVRLAFDAHGTPTEEDEE
jgi:heat shock protein HslJ